ncbi:diacylglycerol/lipid kinase family protein [Desulfitobacterium metallireducens]|uniref:Lipid kinase n=1 Tax=Desulfitobacterium metallireducens DSM 15288 TaxID=871968 RepID=W0EGQ1_9FIRM|nr:diacylglycerol kinase family protein [Desulfitobacterium metallireducens]AHF08231.1 lipid kinase [Desulfitobacterium metallireducens DSM 15288]
MKYKTWFAIVNPASANWRTRKEWPRIHKSLVENNINVDYAVTTYPGEATLLTRQALQDYSQILSVGGDGTLNEVVNGFFENNRTINAEASLGILSHGTGGDFLRSLNQERGLAAFLDVLRRERIIPIDCGLVQYQDSFGVQHHRYFLNVADVGLGGETVARVNRHSKFFGGKLSFMAGSLVSILTYKNKRMKCIIDGKDVVNDQINSIMIANGHFFGGGMMIAPNADFTDGLFDVITLGDFTTLELLQHLPKIYQGKHLEVPGVSVYRGRNITIMSDPDGLLEVDGEQPGCTPAHFSLIPRGIRIWT